MFFYKAFGITIESDILMPQFVQTERREADARIHLMRANDSVSPANLTHRAWRISHDEIVFDFERIGSFLVKKGREIIVNPCVEAEIQLLRLPLLGIALATLLQQRGLFVLHASSVSVNDQAVVFLGWKGAGKSTTAASLFKRGHPMISDDVVAIDDSGSTAPTILSGYPNFKLMPQALSEILGDDPETLSRVCTGLEKRFRPSTDNFQSKDLPLKAVFALADGPELNLRYLSPQDALSSLIANTYLARYGKQLLQNEHAGKNLMQCAKVVKTTPVYRLERPRSLSLLSALSELVESKCGAISEFV